MLKIISCVAVGEVCGDVRREWASFMERVGSMPAGGQWKDLEMPVKITRRMFGKNFCYFYFLFLFL